MTSSSPRTSVSRVSLLLLGFCLTLMLGNLTTLSYGEETPRKSEYLLKAAFLYNIAKFVEWPESVAPKDHDPLILCVTGRAFGASIDSIEGKEVRGHPIAIQRDITPESLKSCHILFLGNEELPKLTSIMMNLGSEAVLTACDNAHCAEAGIMLNLRMVENHVQLDMNLEAVQRTPLKVSSQLIKLTRIVKGQP